MSKGLSSKPESRGVSIRSHLEPGDIGAIIHLHGTLYAAERGWDPTFEAYVAGPLAEFALRAGERDRIWVVESGGAVAGSIAIVAADKSAQLRWFLVHPSLRGRGIGRDLVQRALEHCRNTGFQRVFLWTVAGLDAAQRIYEQAGFELAESVRRVAWGAEVVEQRYDLILCPAAPK